MEQDQTFKVPHNIITKLEGVISKYRNKESVPGLEEIKGIVGGGGYMTKNQAKKIASWWKSFPPKKEEDKIKKDIYTNTLIQWCTNQVDQANRKRQHSNDVRTSIGMDATTHKQKDKEIDRNSKKVEPSRIDSNRIQYYEDVKRIKELMLS